MWPATFCRVEDELDHYCPQGLAAVVVRGLGDFDNGPFAHLLSYLVLDCEGVRADGSGDSGHV